MGDINIHSFKNFLTKIMFLSVIFEAICISKMGNFTITVTFCITTILLLVCIIEKFIGKMQKKKILLGMFFIGYILIVSFFSKYTFNATSIFLYLYYIMFFLFVNSDLTDKEIRSVTKLFIKLASFFAVYAIYQFLAYNYFDFLPLKELIPENLLTPNYNTISYISIGNNYLCRAHSIYLEASFLSQISAIVILLTYYSEIKNKFFIYIVNLIALILSLSGSGILILITGLGYITITQKKYKRLIYLVIIISLGLIVLYANKDTEIVKYYFNRTTEFSFDNKGSSGYYRFILPLKASADIFNNDFFGVGAGNDIILAHKYGSNESGIPNGYGKMFVEFGLIGFLVFAYFLKLMSPNKKDSSINRILFIITIIYCFTGGSFVQNSFWCYAILNLRGVRRKNESDDNM